ncbi:MAG TPA: hypothetical protein VFR34_16345 [Paracoccaceae bacterium]|nr:hypothetical protein [Paracoccaceae bacterium]
MPVVQIQALPLAARYRVPEIITGLSQAIARDCAIPLEHISVTWATLAPGFYAEAGRIAETQPQGSHPVIVHLTAFELEDPARIETLLRATGAHLERALDLPGNVFILYGIARTGRVYAGGEVVAG